MRDVLAGAIVANPITMAWRDGNPRLTLIGADSLPPAMHHARRQTPKRNKLPTPVLKTGWQHWSACSPGKQPKNIAALNATMDEL